MEKLCNIPSDSNLRTTVNVTINSVTISEYSADDISETNEIKE